MLRICGKCSGSGNEYAAIDGIIRQNLTKDLRLASRDLKIDEMIKFVLALILNHYESDFALMAIQLAL